MSMSMSMPSLASHAESSTRSGQASIILRAATSGPIDKIRSHSHRRSRSNSRTIRDENIDPFSNNVQTTAVRELYIHGFKHSRRPSTSRPPLTISIPEAPRMMSNARTIVNSQPRSSYSSTSNRTGSRDTQIRCETPDLQAVAAWVESARKRSRDSREQRAKLVANRLLALHTPKPIVFRVPPSGVPRAYVKSSLSNMVAVAA